MRKILIIVCLICSLIPSLKGQNNKIYENMSLDEILNIDVVVTASKQPEDLFEAPLSVTIIKKEEIERSGATNIPEALRLSPGLIVREITPGNYDVHIRGYDDITKNVYITLPYNTTILVMIDNRIVYNYFTGGTLWETFPIDINDVQQIEVVRGPASALYGPNAATGVINIITTQANKKGMNLSANGIMGSNHAKNVNANIGYNWNDKTKLSFSGNFTERYRFNDDYFNFGTNSYTPIAEHSLVLPLVKNEKTSELWTFKDFQQQLGADYDVDLSLRKMGGNIFLNHSFSEQSNIDFAVGAQKSQCQKTGFLNMVTPLSQTEANSFYLNTRIKLKNLSGQFDVYSGQDLSNYKFNSYKFTNIDANLEYFKQLNNFSFRPGISFKRGRYNSPITYNEPFSLSTLNFGFKDEPRVTFTYAASLLTEWKPSSRLRVIGAARVDKININTNYSINYEIASTYRFNKNNLIRFVYSRANRSTFIFDSYLNCNTSLVFPYVFEGNKKPVNIPVDCNITGSENLKYPTITNREISWRTKIKPNMSLDVELFYSRVRNFVNATAYRHTQTVQQLNSLDNKVDSVISIKAQCDVRFENYNRVAQQYGASFSFNYDFADKVSVKLYGTYQKTKILGSTANDSETTGINIGTPTPEHIVKVDIDSRLETIQWSEKLTPSFFGGLLLNYKPTQKWNFNTDAYTYTNQKFVGYSYFSLLDETGGSNFQMDIKPSLILNAKASYRITKNISVYITLKNILGNHYEYGFADQIGTLSLIGVKWEL